MDLAAEERSGRYRRLLELIEELPDDCRWREASFKDPDYLKGLKEAYIEFEREREERRKAGEIVEDEEWVPRTKGFGVLNMQINHLIRLMVMFLQTQGAEVDMEDYQFPDPFSPVEAVKEELDEEATERDVMNALAVFYGMK